MKYTSEEIIVCASTGVAAQNIGAITFHSATGALPQQNEQSNDFLKLTSQQLVEKYYNYTLKNNTKQQQLARCKVFIIDEISQISANLFQGFDYLLQKIRRNQNPFGGVQLILTGDFMQLPPVSKDEQKYFCFDAPVFKTGIQNKICLESNYRQQHDTEFLQILDKIRDGNIDDQVRSAIQSRQINEYQINQQQNQLVQQARENYEKEKQDIQQQINSTIDLINQQQDNLYDLCKYMYQYKQLSFKQQNVKYTPPVFPIRLYSKKAKVDKYNQEMLKGRSQTIIQFQSYDEGDQKRLDKMEKPDQFVKVCKGAQIMINKNIDLELKISNGTIAIVQDIIVPKDYQYNQIQDKNITIFNVSLKPSKKYQPTIILKLQDGKQYQLEPKSHDIKDNRDKVVATRYQFPLQLAYAITIHKSQGITLENAIVDIGECFEDGQMYVAMSRLKNLNGLIVCNFSQKALKVNKNCLDFMGKLDRLIDNKGQINTKYFDSTKAVIKNKFIQISQNKEQAFKQMLYDIKQFDQLTQTDNQQEIKSQQSEDQINTQYSTQEDQNKINKQNIDIISQDDIQQSSSSYQNLQSFENSTQNFQNQISQEQNQIQQQSQGIMQQQSNNFSSSFQQQQIQQQFNNQNNQESSDSIEIISSSSGYSTQTQQKQKQYNKQKQISNQNTPKIITNRSNQQIEISNNNSSTETQKEITQQDDTSNYDKQIKQDIQTTIIDKMKCLKMQQIKYTELKSQNKIFRKSKLTKHIQEYDYENYINYAKQIYPKNFD